jgi:hypothetical protein
VDSVKLEVCGSQIRGLDGEDGWGELRLRLSDRLFVPPRPPSHRVFVCDQHQHLYTDTYTITTYHCKHYKMYCQRTQ